MGGMWQKPKNSKDGRGHPRRAEGQGPTDTHVRLPAFSSSVLASHQACGVGHSSPRKPKKNPTVASPVTTRPHCLLHHVGFAA